MGISFELGIDRMSDRQWERRVTEQDGAEGDVVLRDREMLVRWWSFERVAIVREEKAVH